jgi:putative ABC transport system permease protein
VAQGGDVTPEGEPDWERYPVRAATDSFFDNTATKLDKRAVGYESDQAVWQALKDNPQFAVIDYLAVAESAFGAEFEWKAQLTDVNEDEFEPLTLHFRNPLTDQQGTVTVIGVLDAQIAATLMGGIYTNSRAWSPVFGEPFFEQFFARVTPGANADTIAKGIRAALGTRGVDADSIQVLLDDEQALGRGFNRLFQAFMALGLVVGIAALGVIAFRSVVERRQQIGMLRAIGYQRGTVTLSFLLESSFISLMGILAGVVGAIILSRNLFSSDSFTSGATTDFFIPWLEIGVFVLIAYVFSLLMTWWPSRQAAQTRIAEALRYE